MSNNKSPESLKRPVEEMEELLTEEELAAIKVDEAKRAKRRAKAYNKDFNTNSALLLRSDFPHYVRSEYYDGSVVYLFAGGQEHPLSLRERYAQYPEDLRKLFGRLVKLTIEEKLYKRSARDMQQEPPFHGCSFLVDSKPMPQSEPHNTYIKFTWRGWGDFVSAVEGELKRVCGEVNYRNKSYLEFYV